MRSATAWCDVRDEARTRQPRSRVQGGAGYTISLIATGCLVITVVLAAYPELAPVYQNRSLHVAFGTVAAFVLLVVSSVLLGRYRRTGSARDLLALAAFLVLAGKNLFLSVATAVVTEGQSEFENWAFHGVRLLGAALLALAAFAPAARLTKRRRAEMLVVLGTAGALAVIVAITVLIPDLPGQFANPPTDRESLERFGQQPVLTALESFAALCYAAAAVQFARHADREGDRYLMWLSIYAVVGSIAFLNYALFPTLYTELIYAGDIFLLASVLAVLVGTTREIAAYQAAVAHAAVLDERRRFARDLHDGVAQELAYIASQLRWTRRQPPTEEEMDQILESVERALDESRGAIAALSRPIDEDLHRALAHAAENVVDRLGGHLELNLEEDVDAPPVWREALTRIVREAVANAVRHGHARTIKVDLTTTEGTRLRISDDGDGFDPSEPRSPTSFGLISMKERTESLGGQFIISSEPGAGTSVEVVLDGPHARRDDASLSPPTPAGPNGGPREEIKADR